MSEALVTSSDIADAFAPLIGHDKVKILLTQAYAQQKIAPAYLFAGPDGVGRSLAARCFAQLIFADADGAGESEPAVQAAIARRIAQGNHPDLCWVEPTYLHKGKTFTAQQAEAAGLKRKTAPQIRLSQIREIARFVSRPPLEASRSVVVIEQAETMAEAAANGLLKTLEEPGQATLILLAPGVDALLPTLVSRSHSLLFTALGKEQLEQVLSQLGQTELLQSAAALALAEGSPGQAIAQWERWQAMPEDILSAIEAIPQWVNGREGSARAALTLAASVTKQLDLPEQVWLIDYLQHQLWNGTTNLRLNRLAAAQHLKSLEDSRQMLLRYVQPLLVWEVLLLSFTAFKSTEAQSAVYLRPEPF